MFTYVHIGNFSQGVYLPLLIIGVVSGAPPSSEPTATSIGGRALNSLGVIGCYIVC